MLNPEALSFAEEMIKSQLTTLDDLPKELANTTANIFYKFALIGIEGKDRIGWVPQQVLREQKGMQEGLKKYSEHCATVMSDLKAVIAFIELLRKTNKSLKPNLYSDLVDYCLDNLKYNIKNVDRKPLVVRKMERPFKKIDEIEGLVDLMRFD